MSTLTHKHLDVGEALHEVLFTPAPLPRTAPAALPARRKHRSCGLTGPGFAHCKRCDMVDAYRARREMYLDELEQCGRGDDKPRPVTFKWWLQVYEWPTDEHLSEAA